MIPYTLIRSQRKTVSLRITREGTVEVRAPMRCSKQYIDAFVASHGAWIEKHQREVRQVAEGREEFSLSTGDRLTFCGTDYTVKIVPGLKPKFLKDTLILPSGNMEEIRPGLLALVKSECQPWLQQRLDGWAGRMGISYKELKLSTAKCRWGSCRRDGVIRISIFLLFAPTRAIDSVLVHELAHRRHFDHSPAFYQVVTRYIPDYWELRKVLKAYQQQPFIQSLAKS